MINDSNKRLIILTAIDVDILRDIFIYINQSDREWDLKIILFYRDIYGDIIISLIFEFKSISSLSLI